MAVAVIQEFPIDGDDRSTTNYDRVQEALDRDAIGDGFRAIGFDDPAGLQRKLHRRCGVCHHRDDFSIRR